MARYFMHLRDGTDQILDEEGQELDSLEAVLKAVMVAARDCMSGDVTRGVIDFRFHIDAVDGAGEVVYTLPFKHAVSIIPATFDRTA